MACCPRLAACCQPIFANHCSTEIGQFYAKQAGGGRKHLPWSTVSRFRSNAAGPGQGRDSWDPYHGPGQADGLAFSVPHGVATPPSLRNINKEIARDPDLRRPVKPNVLWCQSPTGSLLPWAAQGVLLLNTCLTVEQGLPASHSKQGWEVLTDEIIKTIWSGSNPVVFMLWGAHAQTKQALFTALEAKAANHVVQSPHLVLTANHPSPLSALRPPTPFIGCGHFGKANAFLSAHGLQPIVW